MKLPQTGGCQCGAIRYEITEAPQLVYTCHCTDCQRLTSSAFSIGIVVPDRVFRLTGVEPRPLQRIADRFAPSVAPGFAARRVMAWSACVGVRWTIHRGCARQGIHGPAASSPGSSCPRAIRSSRHSRPDEVQQNRVRTP
jgi:Glutathione-dependent formaldehyde-activating enzyme